MQTEKATFGAGCFWGVEETFRNLKGVLSTAVGYTGGTKENPTYKDVCTDETGHAEVVEVEFDPSHVSYDELLDVFWSNHNPTTLNRQGPDVGTQYRSVIFYHSPAQEAAAKASKDRIDMSGRFNRPVVTLKNIISAICKSAGSHIARSDAYRFLQSARLRLSPSEGERIEVRGFQFVMPSAHRTLSLRKGEANESTEYP